jgi:capsular polysaccharide biosynthesis protein
MLLGFVLATMPSVGSVCVAEYLDRAFLTPQDVELYLSVPVLAALPDAKN